MTKSDEKFERKKVAINENTYETLKKFSRYNGLKLRVVIDVMTDMVLNDEVLAKEVINKVIERQSVDN